MNLLHVLKPQMSFGYLLTWKHLLLWTWLLLHASVNKCWICLWMSLFPGYHWCSETWGGYWDYQEMQVHVFSKTCLPRRLELIQFRNAGMFVFFDSPPSYVCVVVQGLLGKTNSTWCQRTQPNWTVKPRSCTTTEWPWKWAKSFRKADRTEAWPRKTWPLWVWGLLAGAGVDVGVLFVVNPDFRRRSSL